MLPNADGAPLQLPEDVLLVAFLPLDCHSLARCACVCRRWRAAAGADGPWRRQLALEFAVPPAVAAQDCKALFNWLRASACASHLRYEARFGALLAQASEPCG